MRKPFLLLVFVSILLCGCKSNKTQAAGPVPHIPVTTATATMQSVPVELHVVGSVEPSQHVEVKSQIAGELMSVHFTEGQEVKQGDLLFEIDPRPYREALRQAEAAVDKDQAQLNQAEATLQKDQVQAKFAASDAGRYEELAKEGVVSKQQRDQSVTNSDVLKESIRADRATAESARASLAADKAAVDAARLNLTYCEIRSPISGRTGNLLVHAGNLVKVNDVALVVINHLAPVFVSFNVPEEHLEAIRRFSAERKLPIQVTSRDDPNAKAVGYLSVVDNTVDNTTGTIHLKGTFENQNRMLWPGQFVNVTLVLNTSQNATVIPAEAVQAGQQGQYVYVVKADETVEPRIVSVGRTVERKVIINKGVTPGERVVTDGQLMLFPGAHIFEVPAPRPESAAS